MSGGARANQKLRTRKDLLEAAARLMREGRAPSFEEVAEAALVSRATAYRYFPGLDALLLEAALHVALPDPDALFQGETSDDPVRRLDRVDAAMAAMMRDNEAALRAMLAQSVQRPPGAGGDLPGRQNRRTPLIEAALEPARDELDPTALPNLVRALALVIGTEAMVVFQDVLRISEAEAHETRRWAIGALVEAARKA